MMGLILVLKSNVCYVAVMLIFLVVTWWLQLVYLVVTTRYLVVTGVTACYRSLLLVPTFSMNGIY